MFLNKIKFNYSLKVLDDLFDNKKYGEATELLNKNKTNKKLYFALLNYINDKYLLNFSHNQFYKKKLFWIIGFDQDDNIFINDFLKFYFNNLNLKNIFMTDYNNFLNLGLKNIITDPSKKECTFQELVQNSNLYQTSSILEIDQDNIILTTSAAFFEAPNNRYFIYPNSTRSYIYFIRNPLQLYLRYKSISNNPQEALNKINQAQDTSSSQKDDHGHGDKILIDENKQSWVTNVKSWADENVISAYRGKVIRYEDLRESKYDMLVEILFHLKQSGLDIDLNYSLINNYLETHILGEDYDNNLSRKETKMILNSLDQSLLEKFEY